MRERRDLSDPCGPLSLRRPAELLGVHRSSLYYKPVGESEENLALMRRMDELFLDDPTLGVLGMQDELAEQGLFSYNVKRIRRLLRKMGIEPIYPKKNLTRVGKASYIQPYLLRGLKITKPNQVWAIDISYVPMRRGFMYLTAIIDLYSRYIVGWDISNSMEKETQTELLGQAISRHGIPEISIRIRAVNTAALTGSIPSKNIRSGLVWTGEVGPEIMLLSNVGFEPSNKSIFTYTRQRMD